MNRCILAADLFCGAGGTSTGLAQACAELGLSLRLLAINHWQVAIDTHAANHPWAEHRCESLDNVDPRKAVPGGRLHLLVASPECTHHSNARGGRPMSDQSRASAWHILRWAEALYIENILIENVREFVQWGPLGATGRPIKAKCGETFRAFIAGLQSLGYTVDWRILNAANYGDPTTRERLFLACSERHIRAVFSMLQEQHQRPRFVGGLEADRVERWHVEALTEIRAAEVWLAYDEPADLDPIRRAGEMFGAVPGWTRHRLRCYVLCGFPGDTLGAAEGRLRAAVEARFWPMAMLWRDPNTGMEAREWLRFQKAWARPAAIFVRLREESRGCP